MSLPLVSVVIPCFNQGHFIADAIKSVQLSTYSNFEIIIVNDGSTDSETNAFLGNLKADGLSVIFQENQGLAGARNTGIQKARGEFILPLDADNMIRSGFMSKSVEILVAHPDVSVVYGNAEVFGSKSGQLIPGPFNLQRMMLGNYIDACAIIRKSVFEKVGLYDKMPVMGYEDWDLWLRIGFANGRFYYLNEIVFDYRMVANSMMRTVNANIAKQNEIELYFSRKYDDKLDFEYVEERLVYQYKKRFLSNIYRLFLKRFYPTRFEKLVRQNKIYKYILYDRN